MQCYKQKRLIPFVVATATVVTAAAVAATETTAAAATRTIFFRLSFHYFNGAAVNCSVIEFRYSFLCSCIVAHFYKAKTT